MKIKADMEVMVKVPRTIEVRDYHEFVELEEILQSLNRRLRVTEIGMPANSDMYLGLIHMNTREHKKLIKELTDRTVFAE